MNKPPQVKANYPNFKNTTYNKLFIEVKYKSGLQNLTSIIKTIFIYL